MKPLSYKDFDLTSFITQKTDMQNFRRNAYGTQMESIWQQLEDAYLPESKETLSALSAKWTLNGDDTATLNSFLADSGSDDMIKFKEPLVAIKAHTALSILTGRTPDVKWDSNSSLYNDRVPILNALRTEDWMDDEVRQQYVMLWFYNFIYGTTYWRRFYSFEERTVSLPVSIDLTDDTVVYEDREVIDIDLVTGEALDPMQVWIDPATRPLSPRSMRKVMYRKVYDIETFHRLFEESTTDEKAFKEVQPTAVTGHTGSNLVACDYYENKDLDLYFVVANDQHVIIKSHLPWNHKQLSIIMATWYPRGKKNPFGLSPVEMMMEDKQYLDEFKSMTLTQTKFSIYKSMFYQGSLQTDGGEGGDLRIRPDTAYKVSDPKSIVFYDMPGPGQDSWRAIDSQRQRVDDASGITRPLGGEITKSTAFEIDLAKDAALARLSVPIASIVALLRQDAYLHFELQKQYYSLPTVKEILDPSEVEQALNEISAAEAAGTPAKFSIWVDGTDEDMRIFRGDFRSVQLRVNEDPYGGSMPTEGKQETLLEPHLFDWKGKIHVIADSLLSITPTIDRRNKLEGYNLLIPMLEKPAELMAKPARELAKMYGLKVDEIFPAPWLEYLKQLDSGQQPAPTQQPGMPGEQPGFQQERAPKVVTNVNGQRNAQSAASQAANPTAGLSA